MAKYKATSTTNPFSNSSGGGSSTSDDITATADAHSTLDVETIGEDDISAADLAAEKMASDDMAVQSNTDTGMNQEQDMGMPASSFNPVGSTSVGVGGENPFDTTTTAAPIAVPAPPAADLPSASEVVSAVKDKASDVKASAGQAVEQAKAAAGQATEQVKAQTVGSLRANQAGCR